MTLFICIGKYFTREDVLWLAVVSAMDDARREDMQGRDKRARTYSAEFKQFSSVLSATLGLNAVGVVNSCIPFSPLPSAPTFSALSVRAAPCTMSTISTRN